MHDPTDNSPVSDDWPDEPDRHDVESFAQSLAANVPQLSDAALARVEEQMRAELCRQGWRRWGRRLLLAGAAASVVLGMVVLRQVLREPGPRPENSAQSRHDPNAVSDGTAGTLVAADPPVRDVFRVSVLVTPAPPSPDKPLIPLDAHRGLFTN